MLEDEARHRRKLPRLWAGGVWLLLGEVALQQALKSLAVAGPPHGASPEGPPNGLQCSAEVNSACAKIFAGAKMLEDEARHGRKLPRLWAGGVWLH